MIKSENHGKNMENIDAVWTCDYISTVFFSSYTPYRNLVRFTRRFPRTLNTNQSALV